MELTGKILDVSFDYVTGKPKLALQIDNKQALLAEYDELKSCEKLTIKISKYRKKRSLNANAYAWVLLDKLAEKLNIPKTEIYRGYIREIGGVSTTVCVQDKAVDELCNNWKRNGIGWQTDTLDSKIDGCTNVILYYGSSVYNTEQMSRLINMIVEDCKLQGIETLTPNEINKMLSQWGGDIQNGKGQS